MAACKELGQSLMKAYEAYDTALWIRGSQRREICRVDCITGGEPAGVTQITCVLPHVDDVALAANCKARRSFLQLVNASASSQTGCHMEADYLRDASP